MVAEELVQDVRSDMKEGTSKVKTVKVATKKASKKAPKPKAAAKGKKAPKAPSAPKKGAVSKAGFVRSQPTTMPAKDVVAAGAKLGLSLSPDYIHKVRSTAKAKAKAPGKKAAPKKAPAGKVAAKKVAAKKVPKKAAPKKPVAKRAPKASAPRTIKAAGAGEAGFRKLVIDLGVVRAKSLLAEVERKLGALIAGK
ncbi:MAG: hypothetical protein HY898_20835 [Deltaproteobacteria bacterium]|nr:hypothetical protein [Deltaproteobacteria bacterium]